MSNTAKIEISNNHTLNFSSTFSTNIGTFDNSKIINNGTLKKSGPGSVLTEFGVTIENNDSIVYVSGFLRVRNMESENGVILITGTFFVVNSTFTNTWISGGTMRIESGITTIQSGTTIDSRIDIISGSLVNNTSLTLNKPFNLSLSGGSVVGTYLGGPGSELILNGKSSWNGLSNMDGQGTIEINDTFTFLGTVNRFKNLSALEVTLNGHTIWTSEEINVAGTTKILNNGDFHIRGSSDQM